MLIPVIIGLTAEYFLLRKLFFKNINKTFKEKKINFKKIIKNKYQCKVYIVTLILLIIAFIIAPIFNLAIWIISPIAVILAIIISLTNPIKLGEKLPWNVLFFMTLLFILVSGFIETGLFNTMTSYLSNLNLTENYPSFLLLTLIATITCGLFNNIPMTTLLTSLTLTTTSSKFFAYPLIIGSNVGANITIIGALAGIMWYHMIRDKNQKINLLEFSFYGIVSSLIFIIITTLILYLEFILFGF